MEEGKACCPFNSSHVFAKENLIFHMNRCKDRAKVQHLFKACQYNSMHFFKKEEICAHEQVCPDKLEVRRLTEKLKRNFESIRSERQRSRERVKREEITERSEKIENTSKEEDDQTVLSDCEECQQLLQVLSVSASTNQKLQKYLSRYNELKRKTTC